MYHILTLCSVGIITVFTGFQFHHQVYYLFIYIFMQSTAVFMHFLTELKYLPHNPNPRGLCMAIIALCRPFTHLFIIQYCVEKANGKLRGAITTARYSSCSKLYIVGRS